MAPRTVKHLIVAATILGALAVLSVLVVPRLVDVNRYRPQVVAYLESKTGKPARIGRLGLTLFPHLAIEIDDFAMQNPKGFPAGDFFKARRIYALLQTEPLWHRKIVIQSLIVENPVIHLISKADGRWNFENPPSPAGEKPRVPASGAPGFALGTISQVRIENGLATIANLLPSGAMGPAYFDGRGLSCRFIDVNLNALSSSASLPSASSGPSRIVSAADNRSAPVGHGAFRANSLRFGAIQASSVESQIKVFPKQAYLDNLKLKFAGGMVSGKAASDFSRQNLLYNVQTSFQNIDVARVLQAFPNTSGKMTGTMEGRLELGGEARHSSDPLSGMQGKGQVKVLNGRLPTLQLNRNLLFLVRMAGIGAASGDPAAFTSISTDLNLANQQLASHHIRIVSNDVDVEASGVISVAASNQMNYTGTASVPARQSGLTDLLAKLSGATLANGKLFFPFDLRGTLDRPRFSLKTGKGILGGLSSAPASGASQGAQPQNTIQNLFDMFRKKKQPSAPPK